MKGWSASSRSLASLVGDPAFSLTESEDGGVIGYSGLEVVNPSPPRENERDNYDDEDVGTQIPIGGSNEGRCIEGEPSAPSDVIALPSSSARIQTDSSKHNAKRSLSPLQSSPYFPFSPSKRSRTSIPSTTTVSTTAPTTTPRTDKNVDSSPDIDSQLSYSVAKNVFGRDDKARDEEARGKVDSNSGSPILFPSNENSLDEMPITP